MGTACESDEMNPTHFRALMLDAAERGVTYLESLNDKPVYPREEAIARLADALQSSLPEQPTEAAEVLEFIDALGSPATVACAGGRYFGFVTGGALPATVAANWLAGAWDQNCFNFVSSPAVALFEDAALR